MRDIPPGKHIGIYDGVMNVHCFVNNFEEDGYCITKDLIMGIDWGTFIKRYNFLWEGMVNVGGRDIKLRITFSRSRSFGDGTKSNPITFYLDELEWKYIRLRLT